MAEKLRQREEKQGVAMEMQGVDMRWSSVAQKLLATAWQGNKERGLVEQWQSTAGQCGERRGEGMAQHSRAMAKQ